MIRKPAVAGMFYPSDPGELERLLRGLFSGTGKGNSLGVVSPHAGYPYSGKGSAFAINSLREADQFIILGPNHTGMGKQFSVLLEGEWETPLGRVKIDSGLANSLNNRCDFLTHMQEHSIEVQLPFLQHRFGRFSFVPVCIMNAGYSGEFLKRCEILGKAAAELVKGKGTGIVASSDFSHYIPLEAAERAEKEIIGKILEPDLEGFFRTLESEQASVCGFGPIAVLMAAARELGLKGKLLHSSNSGEGTGDFTSVVSYRAIGFG
jgi:AmmeMemoRadiSam system protein B